MWEQVVAAVGATAGLSRVGSAVPVGVFGWATLAAIGWFGRDHPDAG